MTTFALCRRDHFMLGVVGIPPSKPSPMPWRAVCVCVCEVTLCGHIGVRPAEITIALS